jgi:hypothetical protein
MVEAHHARFLAICHRQLLLIDEEVGWRAASRKPAPAPVAYRAAMNLVVSCGPDAELPGKGGSIYQFFTSRPGTSPWVATVIVQPS